MGSDPITRVEDIPDELVRAFPHIEDALRTELEDWEGEFPGGHVVVGLVFLPFIIGVLRHGDETEIASAFAFVERLAASDAEGVYETASLSVLEPLTDHPKLLRRAAPHFGPETAYLLRKVEEFWAAGTQDGPEDDVV